MAAPTFNPAAGTYTTDKQVTITCIPSDAKSYYTTDGATPTQSSTLYSTPISIAGSGTNETIKALCCKLGWDPTLRAMES